MTVRGAPRRPAAASQITTARSPAWTAGPSLGRVVPRTDDRLVSRRAGGTASAGSWWSPALVDQRPGCRAATSARSRHRLGPGPSADAVRGTHAHLLLGAAAQSSISRVPGAGLGKLTVVTGELGVLRTNTACSGEPSPPRSRPRWAPGPDRRAGRAAAATRPPDPDRPRSAAPATRPVLTRKRAGAARIAETCDAYSRTIDGDDVPPGRKHDAQCVAGAVRR